MTSGRTEAEQAATMLDITARPFFKQCTRCGGLGYIRYGATRNKCTECDQQGTQPRIRWGHPGDGETK